MNVGDLTSMRGSQLAVLPRHEDQTTLDAADVRLQPARPWGKVINHP